MLIFNRFELSFGYGDVRLNDNRMKKICECHHLKKLYLSSQSNITSIGYSHISKLTSLESLTLSCCKVKDQTLLSLRGLPLKHLDLGHNFEVTERSLEVVVSLPFLEELELIHCGIKSNGINLLSQALNLKKLGLWGVTISKENLKELQKLQQLQSLDLGCRSIEIDQSWIDLLATFPALTKLNIREWKSAQTLDLSPLTNKRIEIIKN